MKKNNIVKQLNRNPNENIELELDFEEFMGQLENIDPEGARLVFQHMVEALEEEGEEVPFTLRLFASSAIYGKVETPVGLVYGLGGLDQLMLTGFILDEDIEEWGDSEDILEEIKDEFLDNFPMVNISRNDKEIGKMVSSALKGTYQVQPDIFECMEGSGLQAAVWEELTKIPYGETISYEELAKRVGKPKAVRAVATAVGQNPISIAIPCHRVVRKSGDIGEYHWGTDIKEKLLAYEKAHTQA